MKYRRESLDKDAKRLLGISGVRVYEVRKSADESRWYFAIVWRDRELTSVCVPWDANKGRLTFIGQNIRYGLDKEQEDEMLNGEQKFVDEDKKLNAEVEKEQVSDAKTLLKIKNGGTIRR